MRITPAALDTSRRIVALKVPNGDEWKASSGYGQDAKPRNRVIFRRFALGVMGAK